jgi:hypothetical protein
MANSPFRVLTIRSAGTTAQWDLYPLLSSNRSEIVAWEDQDVDPIRCRRRASGVTVSMIVNGAERPIVSLRHLRIQVCVTHGRLVLACKRYRTKNAWIVAGPGTGFAARGITSAGSSRRRHGSALVGHVRYPWVRTVSPRPRRWPYQRDSLIIEYGVPPRTPMLLRLDLKRKGEFDDSVTELAALICRRVVDWRRSNDIERSATEDDELVQLNRLAANVQIEPAAGKAEAYELPSWFQVSEGVPYLWRSRTPRPQPMRTDTDTAE